MGEVKKEYFFLFVFSFAATLGSILGYNYVSYREKLISPVVEIIKISPTDIPFKPISLEQIFSTDHVFVESLPKDKLVTIIATGDVIPARSVNFQTVKRNDFLWPFVLTADFLKKADITVINLETPLMKNCPLTQTGMVFCGDNRHIAGLLSAGIDIATLGNNHATNQGQNGLTETISLLENNGIKTAKDDRVAFFEVNGVKFAFLAFNILDGEIDRDKLAGQISVAKSAADVVVVAYHWGAEYTSLPAQSTVKLAHDTIDQGADLILGNHPHWVQPVEIYKGKLITYAHGNFIFDQMWSEKTTLGVVGKYTFYNKRLVDTQFFPIRISDYGQPHFLSGNDQDIILKEMESLSKSI